MTIRRRVARLAVLAGAIAVLAAPATATAEAANWQQIGQLDRSPLVANASCPSSAVCWAIEAGRLVRSSDGGTTWSNRSSLVPSNVASLTDLDCPDATHCYLLAAIHYNDVEILAVHGNAVSVHPLPRMVEDFDCTDLLHCMATDGHASVWTVDGWNTIDVTDLPAFVLDPHLDCVAGGFQCWLGDGIQRTLLRSGDAGQDWRSVTIPAAEKGVLAVSCPADGTCFVALTSDVAVGKPQLFRTRGNGAQFQAVTGPLDAFLHGASLACATTTRCIAAGQVDYFSKELAVVGTRDGTHWTAQHLPAALATRGVGAACAAPMSCVIVSGTVAYATTTSQWTAHNLPGGFDDVPPSAISCSDTTHCVLVGLDLRLHPRAAASADGGHTWTAYRLPAAEYIEDLDCVTASTCVGVGGSSATGGDVRAVRTTDGGRTWSLGDVSGAGHLIDVSCPVVSECLALGTDGSATFLRRSLDGGRTWAQLGQPGSAHGVASALTCADAAHCLLFKQVAGHDAGAWTTSDVGSTWQRHTIPVTQYVKSVHDADCTGAVCVAIGTRPFEETGYEDTGVIMSSHDDGRTWTVLDENFPFYVDSQPGRISCGAPGACAMIDVETPETDRRVWDTEDAGATWNQTYLPLLTPAPASISCAQTSCITAGTGDEYQQVIIGGAVAPSLT